MLVAYRSKSKSYSSANAHACILYLLLLCIHLSLFTVYIQKYNRKLGKSSSRGGLGSGKGKGKGGKGSKRSTPREVCITYGIEYPDDEEEDPLPEGELPNPPNGGACVADRIGRTNTVTSLGVNEWICSGKFAFGISQNSNDLKMIKYSTSSESWNDKWNARKSGQILRINNVGKLALLQDVDGGSPVTVWEVNCGSLSSTEADNVVLRIDSSKEVVVELELKNTSKQLPDGNWGLDSSGKIASGKCKYVTP